MQMPIMPQGQPQQGQPQQIRDGGFVIVKDRAEAKDYPVTPGTSVTFRDEKCEHLFIKTVGANMFDKFDFRSYRIIEETGEDEKDDAKEKENAISYADDIRELKDEYERLRAEISNIKKQFETKQAEKKKPAAKEAAK